MSEAPSLLCAACGRPIALSPLAAGRCPQCGAVHGLGAEDAALAVEVFQVRDAVEAERRLWSEEMARRASRASDTLWGAHPLGFAIQRFTGGARVHRDQRYLASLAYDGAYLDMNAPIRAHRAALAQARVDAELARWHARVRRLSIPVFTRTRRVADPKLWVLPLIGMMTVMTTASDPDLLWLAWIGSACTVAYVGLLVVDGAREHIRRATNPHALALARRVDPRLRPQPLASARMIAEWLAFRWAAPQGPEVAAAVAGASFTTRAAEGLLIRAREADGVARLIAFVPFICTSAPTTIQRRRADALLAELAGRGWRIDVDEASGARAVLAPAGVEFQPSELAPLSDDLRRLCAVPEALGGTSTLTLVTQAIARVDPVAVHQAMQRHHAGREQA